MLGCQSALETQCVLVNCFFFFIFADLPLPIPLSAFQESSRWSQSRMEDLTGLFYSHGTHQSSRFQLGMLRFAQNNISFVLFFFCPCHFLFDANMLFLCSCVHKTHSFSFFTVCFGTSFLATIPIFDVVCVVCFRMVGNGLCNVWIQFLC